MSHLTNIIKKEVKELLTPGSVASVIIMVILFASLGGLIGGEISKNAELPVIGVANYEDQTVDTKSGEWNAYIVLKQIYLNAGIPASKIDSYVVKMESEDLLQEMTDKGVAITFVLSDTFKQDIESGTYGKMDQVYVYEPSGMISGTVSTTAASQLVALLDKSLSTYIIGSQSESEHISFLVSPIDGSQKYTYVKGVLQPDVTPSDIMNALSGQTMLIPMIIMIIIMMVGSIVISSMGSEKENKTLETLLTLPIKRTTIVTGKIVAAAVVGLVFGMAYMLGMGFYIGSLTSPVAGSTTIDLTQLGLTLGATDYLLIMVSMFLSIACALGICMILGAFAKNYKSAQTMTMPLSILAIIPMFVVMFSGWYGSNVLIKILLFAIPFSHPMMATEALLNGDVTLVLGGIAYMTIFAIVSILITVRLYKSDILITGLSQNKYIEKLRGFGKRQNN
jgi:ABC-2 type transport system permease protein